VITELPAELDRNYRIEVDDGPGFVLKVSPPATPRVELEAQLAALAHLARTDLADRVPAVVAPLAGSGLVSVTDRRGEACSGRMLSFLPGRRLVEAEGTDPRWLREIGGFLGRLDQHLESFDHPGAHRVLAWDALRTLEHQPKLEAIGDPGRRRRVEAALGRYHDHVVPALPALRRSVVHNDANDHNLLIGESGFAGLIDFGDLVHTISVAELAIACAYVMLDRPQPLEAAAELVAGFDAVRPLSPTERDVIVDLVLARLAVSTLMAAGRRDLAPGNEYLLVSDEPVARLLARLLERPRDEVREEMLALCAASAAPERSPDELVDQRRRLLGANLSLAYRSPLKIVRGEGAYLFDQRGRRYLDLVNNVCHVGHCHPQVVAAIQRQAAVLNTNTRYLHDQIVEYARRLGDTLPEPLSVCYFVNSGSEANDLALRLALAHTGRREVVVLDHAYHGNSPSLIELSPYKCEGPGGSGLAGHAHKVPLPDPYRGLHRGPESGPLYVAEVERVVERIVAGGGRPGALLAESIPGCGGQIVQPSGFLAGAYRALREHGAVCIADEVQVGLGRVGSHTWAFELQGVVPDIVTLGKPIGNGHPLGAVVTTPGIAASFDNGMEYFNTFGGNPVSCAAGLAVLDVVEGEQLQRRALETGTRFLEGLRELQSRHPLIGDVRGHGLFLGVELVRDRETREPAADPAERLLERLLARGILLSTDGPDQNVLKIKPPLVIGEEEVERVLQALDASLEQEQEAAAR
jgi:4-aminobutyrate aminotransferase-like enzyme